jgi:hypothetical protein
MRTPSFSTCRSIYPSLMGTKLAYPKEANNKHNLNLHPHLLCMSSPTLTTSTFLLPRRKKILADLRSKSKGQSPFNNRCCNPLNSKCSSKRHHSNQILCRPKSLLSLFGASLTMKSKITTRFSSTSIKIRMGI